jgi:hypothetical protein
MLTRPACLVGLGMGVFVMFLRQYRARTRCGRLVHATGYPASIVRTAMAS